MVGANCSCESESAKIMKANMTKPNESEQRDLASQFFTDVLIDELGKRDYVVLAKEHHAALVEDAEAVLERTDIPS